MKLTKLTQHNRIGHTRILKINYITFWGFKKERLIIKDHNSSFSKFLSSGELVELSLHGTIEAFIRSEDNFWDIY